MITIDDKEYEADDLSDEVKYMIAQVRDIDAKVANLKFQIDQLIVAKDAFSGAIVESLKEDAE